MNKALLTLSILIATSTSRAGWFDSMPEDFQDPVKYVGRTLGAPVIGEFPSIIDCGFEQVIKLRNEIQVNPTLAEKLKNLLAEKKIEFIQILPSTTTEIVKTRQQKVYAFGANWDNRYITWDPTTLDKSGTPPGLAQLNFASNSISIAPQKSVHRDRLVFAVMKYDGLDLFANMSETTAKNYVYSHIDAFSEWDFRTSDDLDGISAQCGQDLGLGYILKAVEGKK